MNESEIFNKRVETVQKLLEENYRNLDKVKEILSTLGKEIKRDVYKNIEGIIGTFDGVHLVDPNGNKYDVPANYAAKSRLVYGDSIKMIEDSGSTVFKQIQKVERKKTEGVLSKKEGKWVVLTDTGSYRVSDVAIDFNQGHMNDEVIVFIPATNLNAPYATLDRLVKPRLPEINNAPGMDKQPKRNPLPKPQATTPRPAAPRPVAPKPTSLPAPAPVAVTTPAPKSPVVKPEPLNLDNETSDAVTEISLGGSTPSTPLKPTDDDDDLR